MFHATPKRGFVQKKTEKPIKREGYVAKLISVQFDCGQLCVFHSRVENNEKVSESLARDVFMPCSTTLQWTTVAKAVSYTVEIDCYQCCAVNQWCTDVGKTWSLVSDIKQTTYTFNFVGAQPERWHVHAVDASGQKSPVSGWWTFTYTV